MTHQTRNHLIAVMQNQQDALEILSKIAHEFIPSSNDARLIELRQSIALSQASIKVLETLL